MPTYARSRGSAHAVEVPSSQEYIVLPIYTTSGVAQTIRRIIVDWDSSLTSSTVANSTNYAYRAGAGLTFTTAPAGTTPATPTQGPITDPNGAWWWWQGAVYTPRLPSISGSYILSSVGRIDTDTNRSILSTNETTVWFMVEASGTATDFQGLFANIYYNVLYD